MNRFDALATKPLAWHETAVHFIAAANYLVGIYAGPTSLRWSDSGTNWPVLFLYATAVENLLKAVRVAQGVTVVTKGKLDEYPTSHTSPSTRKTRSRFLTLMGPSGICSGKLQDVVVAGKYPVAKYPTGNMRAWSFDYPKDVEVVWMLLQRLDGALRATGVKCMEPFEAAKLLPVEAVERR